MIPPCEVPCTLKLHTQRVIESATRAHGAAAAELTFRVDRGHLLSAGSMYGTAYGRALCTWWATVITQIGTDEIATDHALRRVRAWARQYLTSEPGSALPGTLFDHAIAHASRAAARDFLTATGELLTLHAFPHEEAK
ncbi:hypothetical protein [Spongiactinospora sp. TRM90649]|uniref:hypothetical protein n=1 Tax=Spongiactinospora sp. TRM90649 TaxID=3031114 RepID=UPI0023F6F70D|nr:hypothetical protein [Spongiactinospora sp. TRM90649]MDF5758791.1 hypothetical protein [Spongiactinospora sp. TRM90649]